MIETEAKPIYKRILVKLSGEALMGDSQFSLDSSVFERLARELLSVVSLGIQTAIVVGGGNLFRGTALSNAGLDRVTGDHMGMLATLMNALAMRDVFERNDLSTRIMSAIPMSGIVDHHDRRKAIHHLERGRIVIFAAGTGNPLVTSDSAASLRGIEINADVILKATQVDGIYSDDPVHHPEATLYKHLTYEEVLHKELAVMDLAAFCQCRDHDMLLHIFNINSDGALLRIVMGGREGTTVAVE